MVLFSAIGGTSRAWRNMATAPNGDIYAVDRVDVYTLTKISILDINHDLRDYKYFMALPVTLSYIGN